jgi:alanyl-tRNA synthetase
MTDEEKKKVEDIINKKIEEDLPVQNVVMPKAEAEKTGARHFFGDKYGDDVSIYFIGKDLKICIFKRILWRTSCDEYRSARKV